MTVGIVVLVLGVLVLAVPNYLRAHRRTASIPRCLLNLRQIEVEKQNFQLEHSKADSDAPTWEELRPCFQDWFVREWGTNDRPVCPAGGTYTLGRFGERPRCSVGGSEHELP